MKMTAKLSVLCLTFVLATPVTAFSEQGMRCMVKPTRDGFVALRRGPNAKSGLVRRLKRPKDGPSFVDNVFPQRRSKGWVLVDAFSYDPAFAEDDSRSVAWQGKGYIRSDLIDWASCNNAG